MKRDSIFPILGVALVLAIVLSGCGMTPALSEAKSMVSECSPEEVVESFYGWYTSHSANPLADGAYRSSEHLAAEFVRKIDGIIASFERGGYDPSGGIWTMGKGGACPMSRCRSLDVTIRCQVLLASV